MKCAAFEYVLDLELERITSAKSLDMYNFLQIKANSFAALATATKRLRSASRYDRTSRSHNIVFFCLGCIFCLSFFNFFFYHN